MQLTESKPYVAFAERSREQRGRLPDRPYKHQRCALYSVTPSHARDRWELRDPCLANDRNLNGRKLMLSIRPPSFAKESCCYCVF